LDLDRGLTVNIKWKLEYPTRSDVEMPPIGDASIRLAPPGARYLVIVDQRPTGERVEKYRIPLFDEKEGLKLFGPTGGLVRRPGERQWRPIFYAIRYFQESVGGGTEAIVWGRARETDTEVHSELSYWAPGKLHSMPCPPQYIDESTIYLQTMQPEPGPLVAPPV
jgi:hypothetical protein